MKRDIFDFTNNTIVNFEYTSDPQKIFVKFFDEPIFDHITEQTNTQVAQCIDSLEFTPRSRVWKWEDAKKYEINILLAFMILQDSIKINLRNT